MTRRGEYVITVTLETENVASTLIDVNIKTKTSVTSASATTNEQN